MWILLLLMSGVLWFGGIVLLVWLVQDMRKAQPASAPATAPVTAPAATPARPTPKDQY
jgi:putative copper export protein